MYVASLCVRLLRSDSNEPCQRVRADLFPPLATITDPKVLGRYLHFGEGSRRRRDNLDDWRGKQRIGITERTCFEYVRGGSSSEMGMGRLCGMLICYDMT